MTSAAASPARWSAVPIVLLIGLATLGKPWLDIPGFLSGAAHRQRSLDLQLFDAFQYPTVWYLPWLNTLGNIALFIPLGALIAARYRRPLRAVGVATLVSATASFAIETAQYAFAIGYTDVDDLLANTVGGFIGAVLLVALPRRFARRGLWLAGAGGAVASAAIIAVMAAEHL